MKKKSSTPRRRASARGSSRAACESCGVRELCIGGRAGKAALRQAEHAISRRFRLKSGEYLYRIGDPFRSLYAVRSGCLRSSFRDDDGREQVIGFHLPGDIVGVGGIGDLVYYFDLVALDQSDICEIHFDHLDEIAGRVPELRGTVTRILTRYMARDLQITTLLKKENPGARLAGFLLDFSQRIALRKGDPNRFRLPMSRADLASHLGLDRRVVTREFRQLSERGMVKMHGRTARLPNPAGLKALATLRP